MRVRRLKPERIKELTLFLIIIVTLVVFSLLIDNYLSGRFFNRVTQGVAVTAVIAAGQSLVIITRNIDLSVGSIAGVSAYLTGEVLGNHLGTQSVVAVLLAVAIGTLLGLVNGALVAYGRIPSIIVTLGTLAIYRTWLISYAEARTITASSLPQWLVDLPALHGVRHRRVRVPHDVRAGDRRDHRPPGAPGARPRRTDRLRHRLQPRSCPAVRACPCGARRSPPSRRAERSPGSAGSSCWLASARSPCRPDRGSNSSRSPPQSSAGSARSADPGRSSAASSVPLLIGLLDQSIVRVPQISEFVRDAVLGLLILLAVVLDGLLARRFVHRRTIMATGTRLRRRHRTT